MTYSEAYSESSDKGHSKRGQTYQQRTGQKYSRIIIQKIISERGQPLGIDNIAFFPVQISLVFSILPYSYFFHKCTHISQQN